MGIKAIRPWGILTTAVDVLCFSTSPRCGGG